jgi:hypothetical protein
MQMKCRELICAANGSNLTAILAVRGAESMAGCAVGDRDWN